MTSAPATPATAGIGRPVRVVTHAHALPWAGSLLRDAEDCPTAPLGPWPFAFRSALLSDPALVASARLSSPLGI